MLGMGDAVVVEFAKESLYALEMIGGELDNII
jgi:hypothetical protein